MSLAGARRLARWCPAGRRREPGLRPSWPCRPRRGVAARWSGAALPAADGGLLVEGVAGFGDGFMLARAATSATTIHPGRATRWHRFDPSQGLERLRDLIATVAPGEGVELTGDVGVTSHAGDLLRRAAIPRGWPRLRGPRADPLLPPRHISTPDLPLVSNITIHA